MALVTTTLAGLFAAGIAATLGSVVARVMIGASLSVVTYVGIEGFVSSTLAEVAGYIGQVPQSMAMLFNLAGLGHAFDVIFSTILACVSVALSGRIAGINFG